MMSVSDHYENLLAEHYFWIYDGLTENVSKYNEFFNKRLITPARINFLIRFSIAIGANFNSQDKSLRLRLPFNFNSSRINSSFSSKFGSSKPKEAFSSSF